jgi:hypothetical protein
MNGGSVFGIVLLLFIVFCVGIYSQAAIGFIPTRDILVITTTGNLDDLKSDCYTQGLIDGRGQILFDYKDPEGEMGVPKGYYSKRTPEWRKYADGESYNYNTGILSLYTNHPDPNVKLNITTFHSDGSRTFDPEHDTLVPEDIDGWYLRQQNWGNNYTSIRSGV